jgi:hypothetical protein
MTTAATTNTTTATPLAITQVLDIFADSLVSLRECVETIPDERMAEQFPALVNHPAWTLGHLVTASAFAVQLLDGQPELGISLDRGVYGPGSTPSAVRAQYASKRELLAALERVHGQVAAAIAAKHDTHFAKPAPEALRSLAPTVGRIVLYLATCHESYHLGQLVQWKKAAGIP